MSPRGGTGAAAWRDAAVVAALFAVDPAGTGGVAVRAQPGPARDRWLALCRAFLPQSAPVRRIPLHVNKARLLGGLDVAATLQLGRPVAERGILAAADGGIVLLAMAERLEATTAAHICAVLDSGEIVLERDGFASRSRAMIGVVALDEGIDDERAPEPLLDRLAFHIDLSAVAAGDTLEQWHHLDDIVAARDHLANVTADPGIVAALCETALALGIGSMRAPLLAMKVANIAAVIDGRCAVEREDLELAARLVLAPRATMLPQPEAARDEGTAPPGTERDTEPPGASDHGQDFERPNQREAPASPAEANDDAPHANQHRLADTAVAAARAAIPAGLLARLMSAADGANRMRSTGRVGALQRAGLRGRPAGVQRAEPRAGARLSVIDTLRAAAPWQRLRRDDGDQRAQAAPRIAIRGEDFRVIRYRQRRETTTIFVVDASGSSALHRLAEAKGAVELLLADCYVRRDRVAVLSFRGLGAEVLLPPTRSLVRARRSLAALAGGGGTPLAAGIDAAATMIGGIRRRGGSPTVVILTDGCANIALDGTTGRIRAEKDAVTASRRLRAADVTALLIDTSPRGEPRARRLAEAMRARYLALPYADANALSAAVRASMPQQRNAALQR